MFRAEINEIENRITNYQGQRIFEKIYTVGRSLARLIF